MASSAFFSDLSIQIWDATSGTLIHRLEGHRGPVFALQFWPDGKTLASASNDRTIRIWDVEAGNQLAMLQGHKSAVSHLELLSGNATLVSGSSDGVVSLWNARAGKPKDTVIRLPELVGAWRFAKDGKSLLTAIGEGQIVRWHGPGFSEKTLVMDVGTIVADWRMGREQFSPDLRYVAFRRVGAEGKIEIWDTTTGRPCQKFDAPLDIHPAAYFSDPHTVRFFERDPGQADSIRCVEWDLSSGRDTRSWTIPIGSPPPSASPGGTPFAQTLSGNIASLFLAVTFSADGERCLISTPARKSAVFNFRTGASELLNTELLSERFAEYSPDGRLLVGRESSEIRLRDAVSLREVAKFPTVMRMPQSVAFSPDGDRLAVGVTGDEAIMLWNPRTRDPLLTLKGTGAQFVRTAFSPDGNHLASRDTFLPRSDGHLHIWSAPTWEEIEAAEALSSRP